MTWLGCLLLIVPFDFVRTDHVDVIEVNEFFDDWGKPVFTQVIFWYWHPARCRLEVRGWRMLKNEHQIPRWDWERNDAFSIWQDGDVTREVRAGEIRRTRTQVDMELVERDITPKEQRWDFGGGKKK